MFFRSRAASDESGQNDGGHVRPQGHSKFLQKRGRERAKQGKIIAARGSVRFAGQACARRSLSAASLFGYFCGYKSNWPARPRARRCKFKSTKPLLIDRDVSYPRNDVEELLFLFRSTGFNHPAQHLFCP
ncbi:hypothetical protein ABIC45_003084 [Mucilaginibacter rubeus]